MQLISFMREVLPGGVLAAFVVLVPAPVASHAGLPRVPASGAHVISTNQPASGTSAVHVRSSRANSCGGVVTPQATPEKRQLGERCTSDCQCASRECSLFKCVVRDYTKHPMLSKGQKCTFDGDCSSCNCDDKTRECQ
jgi:hypothetical protein